jgi:tripartite-type tricarboxylate transporter receptor subunit TctC
MVRVLNQPEVKQKFFNTGSEVVASSIEVLAATVKSDMARMGRVIRDAGIRED